MKQNLLKVLLGQGAKVAASAGAFRILTQLSHRVPGKAGRILRGIVTVGTLVIPLIRKNKQGPR